MPPLAGELELGRLLVRDGLLTSIELDALLKQDKTDSSMLLGETLVSDALIAPARIDELLGSMVRQHVLEALRMFADKLIQQRLLDPPARDQALAQFAARPPSLELGTGLFLDAFVASGKLRPELRAGLAGKLELLAQIHVQITLYGPDLDATLEPGAKLLRIAYQHGLIRADQVLKTLLLHIAQPDRPLREIALGVKLLAPEQTEVIERAIAAGMPGTPALHQLHVRSRAPAPRATAAVAAAVGPSELDSVESLGLGMPPFDGGHSPTAAPEYAEATEVHRTAAVDDSDDEIISGTDASSAIPMANETFVDDLESTDDDPPRPEEPAPGSDTRRSRGGTSQRRPSREGTAARGGGTTGTRRTAGGSGIHRAAGGGSRRRPATHASGGPPWPLILVAAGVAVALAIALVMFGRAAAA